MSFVFRQVLSHQSGVLRRHAAPHSLQLQDSRSTPDEKQPITQAPTALSGPSSMPHRPAHLAPTTLTPITPLSRDAIVSLMSSHAMAHRKHTKLFKSVESQILSNLSAWNANELASVCRAWAALGFLHEEFCLAIAGRVEATAYLCESENLVYLVDAYATTRCGVRDVVEKVNEELLSRGGDPGDHLSITSRIEELDISLVALHASSLARLNYRDPKIMEAIRSKTLSIVDGVFPVFGREIDEHGNSSSLLNAIPSSSSLSAREVSLLAYSFAKLGFADSELFNGLEAAASHKMRDFTAKDLQMMATAFARFDGPSRVPYRPALLGAISAHAQRRIAQFSAPTLTALLHAFSHQGGHDSDLATRVVAQLPRLLFSLPVKDVLSLSNALVAMGVRSPTSGPAIVSAIKESGAELTLDERLSVLKVVGELGGDTAYVVDAVIDGKVHAARLRPNQLIGLVTGLCIDEGSSRKILYDVSRVLSAKLDSITPEQAADMYCAYAKIGAHELDEKLRKLMQNMLSRSLQGSSDNDRRILANL